MYEVSVETGFSAAHLLRDYAGRCENLHGHNWKVRIIVGSEKPDKTGLVIDFKELRSTAETVVERFDHVNLNDLPEFKEKNPTTENIARIIFEELSGLVDRKGVKVKEVRVGESEGSWASYRE